MTQVCHLTENGPYTHIFVFFHDQERSHEFYMRNVVHVKKKKNNRIDRFFIGDAP